MESDIESRRKRKKMNEQGRWEGCHEERERGGREEREGEREKGTVEKGERESAEQTDSRNSLSSALLW